MRTIVNKENYEKYNKSKTQMETSEARLKELFGLLEKEMQTAINATNQMAILQEQLAKVQMSNRKPESTKAYINYLIQNEQRAQEGNYLQRIEGYNDAIKQL